ncbi:hypothetical protein FGG08_000989 [Glutinoglossum americanum]|uniref:Uncharacterized protein n=1 Tax=Glutinoglossum americanum TaxID=1670608 RepID=A0A9P8I7T5_9PEZI|nr:hypothetical protein FGG08_000989 [Glutinoglossum americanum]
MEPISLVKPLATRPLSQWASGGFGGLKARSFRVGLRDNFTISTWLLVGATLQSALLLLLPARFALVPPFMLLMYRFLDTVLMAAGWKKNIYLEGVIPGKFSAQIPDAQGRFSKGPSSEGICVFLIGARSNHPLGMFAPGFKEIGDYFREMIENLERDPEEFGWGNQTANPLPTPGENTVLGASSWINLSDRTSSNELMTVCYFRNVTYLHAFAHGPAHRAAWNWWNKHVAGLSHIAIMHELYQTPPHAWENIYINYRPTGLAATTHRAVLPPAKKGEPGVPVWLSPIVDARKGRFRSSAGRMAMDTGDGNEKYGDDPYAEEE